MNALIHTLASALKEKIALYHLIMTVLEEEQVLIRDGGTEGLWATSSRKNDAVRKMEDIRKTVLKALESEGIDHGMTVHRFSPGKAVSFVGDEGRALLMPLVETLNQIRRTVHDMSKENVRFTREYLTVVESMIGVFAKAAQTDRGYSPGYRGAAGNTNSMLFNARV